MGFVNFKTWTAEYCDWVYRAIGKEVSKEVMYTPLQFMQWTYFVVWNLGTAWKQAS